MKYVNFVPNVNHSFNKHHAIQLGSVDLAILVGHFIYWIDHHKTLKKNFHEGRTWNYSTIKQIAEWHPYWSEEQTRRLIEKLVEKGVLIKGNFNKIKFDRTVWYAFKDEEAWGFSKDVYERQICQMHSSNLPNGPADLPNGKAGFARPIPYTKTNAIEEQQQDKSEDVVVVSSDPSILEELNHLNLTEAFKKKIIKAYSAMEISLAIKRVISWVTRESDAAAMTHCLNTKDWQDKRSKKDIEKENLKYLKTIRPLDGTYPNKYRIDVGRNYVEFIAGMKVKRFEISENDFIEKVKGMLK